MASRSQARTLPRSGMGPIATFYGTTLPSDAVTTGPEAHVAWGPARHEEETVSVTDAQTEGGVYEMPYWSSTQCSAGCGSHHAIRAPSGVFK